MGKLWDRCYFHLVSSDDAILDETGVEVADLAAAEAEALRAIQELREEEADQADEAWRGWQINVTDQFGSLLLTIPLDTSPERLLGEDRGQPATFSKILNL